MTDPKDYIYVLPLLGGILTIISVVSPTAYLSIWGVTIYYWMWGLTTASGMGMSAIEFNPELISLISGIICSVLIIAFGAMMLLTANKVRKSKEINEDVERLWLIMGVLVIILTIFWIVIVNIFIPDASIFGTMNSFWGYFNPGFGVVGPFIGAGLTITGVLINRN